MVRSDEKNNQVSDLVDRCDEESLVSSPPNASAPLPDSTFKPPIASSGPNLVTKPEEKYQTADRNDAEFSPFSTYYSDASRSDPSWC